MPEFLTDFLASLDLEALSTQSVSLVATWGGQLLSVLLILLVGRWLARRFARVTEAAMERARVDQTLRQFASSMVYYGLLAFTIIAALQRLGIEATSIVALLGAAGFAVGLALQGTLGNFSSGVMLLVFRPYNVGDFVVVAGQDGHVRKLGIFNTTLETLDSRTITIPNGAIFGDVIENHSGRPVRRVDVMVGVAYDADIDQAKAVLVDALERLEGVAPEPAPDAYLMELGGSSVDFQCRCYCAPADYWAVRQRMVRAAKLSLDAAGIGIPFPQTELHIAPGSAPLFAANAKR
jgi:small conductance mechanosensitive channel